MRRDHRLQPIRPDADDRAKKDRDEFRARVGFTSILRSIGGSAVESGTMTIGTSAQRHL